MDLFAELTALVRELDADGVDYALCGAVALAIHGAPRGTQDIDLLVRSADLAAFREVARRCGFTIEALPMTFSASGITVHRFTKLAGPRPLMLDALLAEGPTAAVWADRVRIAYAGGEVSVVSRAGLVTLKLAAGRPQDIADIKRLEEIDGGEHEP